MKKARRILLCTLALLTVFSCVEKPDPDPGPEPETPEEPKEDPEPGPEPEPEPDPKDVKLMEAFREDFSSREVVYLDFARRTDRDDFRYYSGFPSLSERGATILMLRLDPADGAGEGTSVTSRDYVHYGSYSARIRMPDIASVQAKLGASAEFSLFDQDPVWGTDEYTLGFRLADARNLYLKSLHRDADAEAVPVEEESVVAPGESSFKTTSRFYIYGMDWTPDRISWWMKTSEQAEKTLLAERTANIPDQPLRLQFRLYHTKTAPPKDMADATQAPYYPFELEIDWIKYTPSEP